MRTAMSSQREAAEDIQRILLSSTDGRKKVEEELKIERNGKMTGMCGTSGSEPSQ